MQWTLSLRPHGGRSHPQPCITLRTPTPGSRSCCPSRFPRRLPRTRCLGRAATLRRTLWQLMRPWGPMRWRQPKTVACLRCRTCTPNPRCTRGGTALMVSLPPCGQPGGPHIADACASCQSQLDGCCMGVVLRCFTCSCDALPWPTYVLQAMRASPLACKTCLP